MQTSQVTPSWRYSPTKRFTGNLWSYAPYIPGSRAPSLFFGNAGYVEEYVKDSDKASPSQMNPKDLKQYRRYCRYVKELAKNKKISQVAAAQLLLKKYRISLSEAKSILL